MRPCDTSRISDLRKAGYDVRVWSQEHRTGLVVYGIGPSPESNKAG